MEFRLRGLGTKHPGTGHFFLIPPYIVLPEGILPVALLGAGPHPPCHVLLVLCFCKDVLTVTPSYPTVSPTHPWCLARSRMNE